MNILITGAAGQIGHSLAKRLIAGNHNCYLTGYLKTINPFDYLNGGHEYKYESFRHYGYFDISNSDGENCVEGYMAKFGGQEIEVIIHLAAITSLPECEANPAKAFNTNVGGTANILDFARKAGVPHVIFASTSAVYENNSESVFTEDLTVNPKLVYSQSKKMAEDMIISYRDHYGMCITTLRLFNVFGPDGDSKRLHPPLLNHLVREFKKNGKTTLSGDGSQARDFIHIDDILSAITACLIKKSNETINICSGQLTSVKDFAAAVADELEFYLGKLEISYKPASNLWDAYPDLFSGDFPLKKEVVTFETNKRSLGSNKKAKEVLDWTPDSDIIGNIKKSAVECFHKI